MGAALMAFLNAELRSGIEIVTQALNLEEHILDCSLVVTGEGRLDSQSITVRCRSAWRAWRKNTVSR
jgi:glycerate kinase